MKILLRFQTQVEYPFHTWFQIQL